MSFAIQYKKSGFVGDGYGFDQGDPIRFNQMTLVDFDGDGIEELLVTGAAHGQAQEGALPVLVFASNGKTLVEATDRFLPAGTGTEITRNIIIEDFNGDDRPDIFFLNHGNEVESPENPVIGEQNQLLLSTPSGKLENVTATSLPQLADYSHGGGAGDFDGDGDVDILVNAFHIPAYIMLNNGQGHFTVEDEIHSGYGGWFPDVLSDPPGDGSADEGTNFYYADVFDINGDGFADIWTSGIDYPNFGKPTIHRALLNDQNGHFILSGDTPLPPDPTVYVGEFTKHVDFDHDGDLDLFVLSNPGTKEPGIIQLLVNDGAGNFVDKAAANGIRQNLLSEMTYCNSFDVVDLEGDGDQDIVLSMIAGVGENHYFGLINDGEGHFKQAPKNFMPHQVANFKFMDANKDGLVDLLTEGIYNLDDPSEQFLLYKSSIIVAVNRTGWATDDKIAGGTKNDRLSGLGGADQLIGNGGKDKINGGDGDDILDGRAGHDTLTGGAGADQFVYSGGNDVVTDFNEAEGDVMIGAWPV